ncbi:hypothetical protein L3X38_015738 [Prunus dulcis]|uniref:Glucose-methanol-choline oxidoreductase C-terminal domain-containing protein n=1 Tax=Prunus dulcis TaxID=3755 RepID=A0AAD4Z8H1_PRUDU|nr:hypothetical protein L3X38_015738 [Prunus dulcis]
MAFWSFKLAEPGHECVDLSKASDWFQVTNTLPSMLVELHMSGCELNQIPVGVANMTRLKVVNLRWNIIWGTIPQWLYTCSNFESLSLYLNLLRGEISSSIGNLTAIVNLDLSANQIEGKMPNSLGNLCKLAVLDLSRNYFNGSVSEILGSLSGCSSGQMESLKLSTNDFSGPLSCRVDMLIRSMPMKPDTFVLGALLGGRQIHGKTIWHYHGGCQVGRVVDKGYGVLGIDSLRVIDGSTFYHTPAGANPQATVMMLGRYMGQRILHDRLVHGSKMKN